MATSFADILRQQQAAQQVQQNNNAQMGNVLGQAGQLGGRALANILRGGGGGGAAASAGGGGTGFGLGQPLVGGQMGASSMAGGGAMTGLGPLLAAGATAYNADRIGKEVGRFGDKLGLEKTGLPDQARMVGNFVKGDFGGAWGNLKDSVKNIFSIF